LLIWEGATVTFVALQLAYYMGFKEIYLVGVDHKFTSNGEPHQVITSLENDMNHFSPNYFGPGFRWQLPDLEASEYAYELAKKQFEKNYRKIMDATIDGNLNVFPKVDYNSLFE
jgi:hypothetical protein